MSEEIPPAGWLTATDGTAYPPPPWRLGGRLVVSVWQLPGAACPSEILHGALPPRLWLGRVVLATAFAVYEPGGVLSYNELLLAVRVRAQGRGAVNVPRIWVDSPESLAGARALWSIPKEFARFETTAGETFEAQAQGDVLARLRFTQRLALPGWWRTRISTAQEHSGALKITRTQALSRIAMGAADWEFPPASPLAFLRGRRPLVSLRLDRMTLAFGI